MKIIAVNEKHKTIQDTEEKYRLIRFSPCSKIDLTGIHQDISLSFS
jgi:hypothetical protein